MLSAEAVKMIRKPSSIIVSKKQAKTCLPPSMLSSPSIVHVNRQVSELKGCSAPQIFSK